MINIEKTQRAIYIKCFIRTRNENDLCMKYYPVYLDIAGKSCLVVGGGRVGTRKALGLARANARVTVVSPEFSRRLETDCPENIRLERRGFDPVDLDGVSLVFAATDSMALNARIRDAARQAGILCNAADGADKGDFILPSVVNQGDLTLAISTGGASPALAKRLRRELESRFGPEYGTMLTLMANLRQKMLDAGHDPDGHKRIFSALIDHDLPALISAGRTRDIDALLARYLGTEFTYDGLTVQAPDPGAERS